MGSFRTAAEKMVPGPYPMTAAIVAQDLGLALPVSLRALMDALDALPEAITFHQDVVTPDFTALGGFVDVTLYPTGHYDIHWYMYDSGFDSYSFKLVAIVASAGKVAFAAQTSGSVGGTLGGGSRAFDRHDAGDNPTLMQSSWSQLRSGTLSVSKAYQDTGVLGAVESVVSFIFNWLVAAVETTLGICALILLGPELLALSPLPGMEAAIPDLEQLVGWSGQLLLWAVGVIIPVWAVGVSTDTRRLGQDEIAFVYPVFKDTISYDQILLTNLTGLQGRPFTFPVADPAHPGQQKILVNIGVSDAMYHEPTKTTWDRYTKPGQLLVHELTHAWQIANATFVPGWMCDAIAVQLQGSSAYDYGLPGPDFGTFTIEAQASIVDQWFGGTWPGSSGKQMSFDDPYFEYIANNIWLGQP